VAVAVGNVDSFVSLPGAGVEQPGTYVMVVGTSICDMVVDPREIRLPGITGVVRDGILPGVYGYEAGQVAVGDMLAWFTETFNAGSYGELEEAAGRLAPGESGLVALDWWNGNRSILADADLTGVICGLTLQSTEPEVYRALLESIALGNRRIIENFQAHGIELSEIVACGGIAEKSPLQMQLIADISGLTVHVPASTEVPARGSALFGAVAAGTFTDIGEAIEALRPGRARSYAPQAAAKDVYDRVYEVYRGLYETLGRSQAELLHRLKRIGARSVAA
jgi:L-ribulokinase